MKFTLKENLLALAILSSVTGIIGCSSTAKPSNTEPNKTVANYEKANSEKTDKYPASTNRDTGTDRQTDSSSSGDKIGVPECDEYIEKYEACITGKVPEAARQQIKASFEMTRKSWKDLAANPNTKSSLASACKQSQAAAKQAMSAYHCDF